MALSATHLQVPRTLVVIPARLGSTRLPEKMLLAQTGKPLIQHTFETARSAQLPLAVVVATDHPRIRDVVVGFGGEAVLTNPAARSGTDRVAEIAVQRPDIDLFVNLQGDEPELPGALIDQVIQLLHDSPEASMATLAVPIRTRDRLFDPSCVKVVCNARGQALYFSRSPIPYPRDWDERLLANQPPLFLQHLGLYAYRRELLVRWPTLPVSALETTESLEQLRALEAGETIQVGITSHAAKGIDTWDDYQAFVARHATRHGV